jgi:DNA-binding transcriptional LysR family regulator
MRGVIRIAAADVMGVEVLPPILTGFRETHPDIAIELALSNRQEDLLRREADIAVRMVRPTQASLVAKRVGSVRLGLYAHKRYIEAHGVPTRMDEPGHAPIGFDRDLQISRSLMHSQISLDRETFAFRSDNDLAQLAALRAGFGVGACHAPLARRNPDLVQVLEGQFRYEMEVWIAMHEDLKTSRRMRAMFDWLVEGLGEYVRS